MNSISAVIQNFWLNLKDIIQRWYHYRINFTHSVFKQQRKFVLGARIDANCKDPRATGPTIEKVERRLRCGMRVNHLFPLSLFRFHLVEPFTYPQTIIRQMVEERSYDLQLLCPKLSACYQHYFGNTVSSQKLVASLTSHASGTFTLRKVQFDNWNLKRKE